MMKLLGIIINLLKSLYSSLRRFPVSIILAIMTTIVMVFLVHVQNYPDNNIKDTLGRIAMILALGFSISLCIKLMFERFSKISPVLKASIYLAEAIVLTLYYFFLLKSFDMVPVSRYIALSIAVYLAFLFTPYFFRREGFELYIIKLFTRFLTAVVYSVVLYLGIAAILFTVDKLLGVNISEKLYLDVWVCVVGIFAPSFFLAGVPTLSEQMDLTYFPKLFRVLLLYIVMPILSIYTVILYIYFAKILITLQWPVGLVSHLVLWYSVIIALVIFFISPLRDENNWVRIFITWLTKLILPLILMMFISIVIRINAYGITENRYYVIVLGLWAFGIMIYLGFFKIRRNIVMLVTLSLIAALSVSGPWSSYSISKFSQNKRFESILLKNSMLKEGKIIKSVTEVPKDDKTEVSQILEYFSRSHTFNDIRYLPKDFKMDDIEKVFGFAYSYPDYSNINGMHFSYNSKPTGEAADIKGYEYFFDVKGYAPISTSLGSDLELKYDNEKHEMWIILNNKEIYRSSVSEFVKQLYKKYGSTEKFEVLPEDMIVTDENEKAKVKIIFQNINGTDEKEDGQLQINSADFYVFLGLK